MKTIGKLLLFTSLTLAAHATERWGVFELSLAGPASGNRYLDVQWSATFTQGDRQVNVPGFWDGDGTFKARFSPPTAGEWRYQTRSATPELNGKTGTFTATATTGRNHGPIEVFDTFYLRYADGTPYHQFGTTCYAWVHQTRELQEQTLKTLAVSPFNKIRFCVFPKSYEYNRNEPELFAFQKDADGKFDFHRPDPAFWRHFEQRILDLQGLGIEADLILWHPYDRWGFARMNGEQDDRYLRYCIARFGAFRNVWWSLANEYDFMSNLDGKHPGRKTLNDWDRFFAILEKEDPHQRLRGIHNGAQWYDHTKAWVTHASLQTSDMNAGLRFRNQYQKPVIYDECRYEGNIPEGWGNLTAREMAQKFWLGTMSGCYVGHGETYKHPEDVLWWAKGGVLRGDSPKRIQWLKEFMAQAPPFHKLQPLGDTQGRFVLAQPKTFYLVYCVNTRPQVIELAGARPYKVDLIDPWAMTISPAGTARPGTFTVAPHKADVAFRFTPYAAGEPLRPEARIEATPTEGIPPMTVTFKAITDAAQAEWDFGDGTNARGREVQHTFTQPGAYPVTLKVTDQRGGTAVAATEILADRDVSQPIVRAGFATSEQPVLKLHGSAKRGPDGVLVLPEGSPWGWVQVGDGPLDDLRGLRSFTVLGWLKPESLQTGSGGNRILFCLNRDGDGIDLVCHADGRLRLSVNQWPDSVRNDSSPAKLVVGKWTFFAVSYDASRVQDNVKWHFTPPLDAPGMAELKLDRTSSYNHGPVGMDLRGLVIGNFNETMHSYGLDRQFRGEIRGLEIFGSRTGAGGCVGQPTLEQRLRAGSDSSKAGMTPRSAVPAETREARPSNGAPGAAAGPIKTELRREDGRFRLYRGGQPYHVKGVVYTGDRGGRFPLKDVAAQGANSIRSSGGLAVLDEAHRLGLSVLVNLGMRMEKVHNFDYSDEKAVGEQLDRIKERIRQLKDHPAVLMWAIGNELTVFEATNKLVWKAVNDVARFIHEVDPNHPCLTVVGDGSLDHGDLVDIRQLAPDLDLLSVNYYGGIETVPSKLRKYAWDKPYIVNKVTGS